MADPTRNLESILAALAAQKAPTSTPPQGQPGLPPPPAGGAGYQMPQAPYQQPPAPGYGAPPAYSYPQPTSSGNLDLSAVQPTQSGSVSIDEAIARAKAHAARNGVTPYERPAGYSNAPRGGDGERYRGSRSRSPPARRDAFRDNHNPYRDERREDRGGYGGGRDRSFSPRGHDRNSGAFSPRGGHAGGRDGGDDNSEIIEVEASLVGLIIGRQGENLRRVEGDSQCRVQFLAASSPNAEQRQCKITGPRARRAEAKAAINRIIEDSGMGAIARAGLDRGGRDSGRGGAPPAASSQPPPLKEGEDCLQIMVPDRTVGLIIGRGGETIRDLQERSGCHVNIVGESKSVNGLRPVNLIGPRQAAIVAKDLIMEIVDSDSRNTNSGGNAGGQSRPPRGHHDGGAGGHDKINDSMYVPSEAVGMIIGKGGETIREIQSTTGCKINVSQSSGPGETEREIGLVGSREAISMAKQAIEDKVDAVRQKGGHPGGGGGRGRPHRDYDNPNYGQPSHQAPSQAPAAQPPAGGSGDADPYAAYGGYQAYLTLWYAYAQQQQAQGGDAGKPPGTA